MSVTKNEAPGVPRTEVRRTISALTETILF